MNNSNELTTHLSLSSLIHALARLSLASAFVAVHALTITSGKQTPLDMLLLVAYFLAVTTCFALVFLAMLLLLTRLNQLTGYLRQALPRSLACFPSLKRKDEALSRKMPQSGKGAPEASQRKILLVHTADKSIPVPVEQICYFFREGRHTYLRTFDREDYLIATSLSDVHRNLDKHSFFRVNRQLIIHYRACRHFRSVASGKLVLRLLHPLPYPVVVSQLKATQFKRWLQR